MVAARVKQDKPTYYMSRTDYGLSNFFNLTGFLRVQDVDDADVVVFGGGADVNPFLYGDVRHSTTQIDYNVDMIDLKTLKQCGDYQGKVGVCRGAQFLNCMVGNGMLYQHVTDHAIRGTHGMMKTASKRKSLPDCIQVTSTHHQMMIPGPDAEIIYCANLALEKNTGTNTIVYDDKDRKNVFDDVEVVHYMDRCTLCYQPHPEYAGDHNIDNKEVFLSLVIDTCIDDKFSKRLWENFYESINRTSNRI